ncbi:Arylsulfatase precursor [Maioricimonas rarisocia]|uniref:Arylsulfatase n=1 Tax=Maioricimonas rarisocia TaxID=2528026 RepID=A0A517ZEK7_9PLAN|nr:sulfatase-like hydrolase/transferase [Maioricimonas rarisocia]QDU40896.1 Arylsulfatase precursor [Maioricimonas rarisocia]
MRYLIAALSLLLLMSSVTRADVLRPNVIVIFSDDHGYADLSCQGVFDDVRTPHIDSLAAGGVRMTSGYVTAPQCVPSRAGLLAGQYQNRFGVESNGVPLDGFNALQTIAERLKGAGYATGMTGKWHLGPQPQIPTHGFDDVYYKNANRPGWANFNLDGSDREPGPEDSKRYHLDVNSAAACAFIRRHHDEPFFFYCAYRAPHVPLDAPPKYLSRFPGEMPERRRKALAMISAMDDGVGQMLATLREHDLEERTLIFFIGDNGAPLKIHKHDAPGRGAGWDGSLNDPLNGEKGMLSEGGIRVPFVAYWKGTLPAGLNYDHPVISLDVAATAVALAGLPADPQLDGVNLIPHLTGEEEAPPHETLFWRWISQSAVREGKWKYLRGGAREYLFDLDADPEEKHDLLAEHPEIAARLEEKLAMWAGQLDPPGLETREMSQTWESYFDFYLDGKPAPPLRAKVNQQSSTQGWIVRSGKLALVDGALRITPQRGNQRRAFIASTDVKVPGPAAATVTLRASEEGRASISWRTEGQKDFPAGQSVSFDVAEGWQTVKVDVPAKERIIHIRFVPPQGTTDVKRITLSSVEGNARRVWSFDEK